MVGAAHTSAASANAPNRHQLMYVMVIEKALWMGLSRRWFCTRRGRRHPMKTHQLIIAALLAALIPASACNRADTDENARRAATGMREAALRAGDQLADSWLTT